MTLMIKLLWMTILASFLTSACLFSTPVPTPVPPTPTFIPTDTATPIPTESPLVTSTPLPLVPNFSHIAVIIFENRQFDNVIHSPYMPYFNVLANTYTLLTQYYAVTHPSLPNYLSIIRGRTFCLPDAAHFSCCSTLEHTLSGLN